MSLYQSDKENFSLILISVICSSSSKTCQCCMLFGIEGQCLICMWYFSLNAVGGVKVEAALANASAC
jgi:hypothetical protein